MGLTVYADGVPQFTSNQAYTWSANQTFASNIILTASSIASAANYTIFQASNFMDFNVPSGKGFNFLVNNSSQLIIDANGNFTTWKGTAKQYGNVSTAGVGLPPIFGAGLAVSLNTVSTAVCSYTPQSNQHYRITWVLSCPTASTPTLTLTWTDPKCGAQSITLYNTAMGNNTVQTGSYSVYASTATAIAVTGSDSVALGDIFATATIEELQ